MEQNNKYKNKTILREKYTDIKYLKFILGLVLLFGLVFLLTKVL